MTRWMRLVAAVMTTGAVSLRTIGATAFSAGSLATSTATVNVVGSIAETGAKLIEYPAGEEGAVRAALPGLRLVPEVFYEPLSVRLSLESNLQPSGSGQSVQVTVRSATSGNGIPHAKVVAFTNFALRMDGTSMACPAVTGVAARLLGGKPAILGMARDSARATAIANLLLTTAQSRGFTPNLEGRGLPQ